jgi:hypothetical protein
MLVLKGHIDTFKVLGVVIELIRIHLQWVDKSWHYFSDQAEKNLVYWENNLIDWLYIKIHAFGVSFECSIKGC